MDYSKEDSIRKIKKYKSKTKKVQNKIGLLIFRILLAVVLVVGFAGGGAVLGAYLAILNDTPTDFEYFVIEPTKYSTKIVDKDGREVGSFKGEEDRESAAFEDVSQNFKNAIIAIEDERFYSHNGIDVRSIMRSVREIFLNNNLQGASTITQQLIKMNITKVTRNSLESKLKEQYLAINYEEFLTEKLGSKQAAKDYILSVYMNSIPMNHGLYGVQTAANYYFGKDVSDLTLSEASVLAGITNSPVKYSPDTNPENNKKRQKLILDKMLELEMITQAQFDEAWEDDVYARVGNYSLVMNEPTETVQTAHSFYEDQIYQTLLSDLMEMGYDRVTASSLILNGGLTIVSAQDLAIQKIVDNAYLDDSNFPAKDYEIDVLYLATIQNTITGQIRNIEEKKTVKTQEEVQPFIDAARAENLGPNDTVQAERHELTPQPQSAFAIIDYHTGQVKAMAGGRGEKTNSLALNRATESTRSPGSTFKVVASYAPAIDMGVITPATVYDDVPYMVDLVSGPYVPNNWYSTGFRGYSTVRQGITNSMNVITVKNLMTAGIDNCFEYLKNFGFTTLVEEANEYGQSDKGPSLALGGLTNGVTQVELAAAYGTIANDGYYNKPIFYTQVFDRHGDLLVDNTLEPRQVLKKTSAYLLTDMMEGVLTDSGATGGKARFETVEMPIAGKTGTSTDTYDLVFAGYTPYYAASVWFGFDIPKPIEHASGDHIILWRKIMEEIHRDLPYRDFERPDGIVSAQVCRYSGKLAVTGLCDCDPRGSAVRTEIFASGTVPTESCDIHASVEIDTSTGMLAGPYCPPEVRETRIGIIRKAEDAGKANDAEYEVNPSGEVCTFHNMFNSTVIPNGFNNLPQGLPSDLDIFMPGNNNSGADNSGGVGSVPAEDIYPGNGTQSPAEDVYPGNGQSAADGGVNPNGGNAEGLPQGVFPPTQTPDNSNQNPPEESGGAGTAMPDGMPSDLMHFE
ncbi:MAG: transglycosylase domain-containing protein [Clostridiales bacterium]|jgi:penicillin-binding protein 1A|nr:transglycosylase domain-containing protein [Clostridiales bacterium]